jgi:hypothetical protein
MEKLITWVDGNGEGYDRDPTTTSLADGDSSYLVVGGLDPIYDKEGACEGNAHPQLRTNDRMVPCLYGWDSHEFSTIKKTQAEEMLHRTAASTRNLA